MAVFLRKLLRIGKLPGELREAVEAEGVIHYAEYVPVTRRFTGKVPGKRSVGSVTSFSGSLVFTSQRVLGTLSTVPKLAGRAIDLRWDAPQSGPVIADISCGRAGHQPRCRPGRSAVLRPTVPALQGAVERRGAGAPAAPVTGLRRAAGVHLPRRRGAVPPVTISYDEHLRERIRANLGRP